MYNHYIQSAIESYIGLSQKEAKWIKENSSDKDVQLFYKFFDITVGSMNPFSLYYTLSYLEMIRDKMSTRFPVSGSG